MWIAGWIIIRHLTRLSSAVSPRGTFAAFLKRGKEWADHESIWERSVDKAKSTVTLSASGIDLDLYLPSNKRCVKRVDLYSDIDVEGSDFKILSTKVRCQMKPQEANPRV